LELSELEKKIRSLNKWPSLYSTTSLKEALAEYYATYLVDPDFTCSHQFDSIAIHLTHPNAQDVSWNNHFNDAVVLFDKNLVAEAVQKFETCTQIDARAPMPYVYLSRCYWKIGDFENCIANSKSALENLEISGVCNNDDVKFHLLILYAQALQATSKFEESKKIIDEALKARPTDAAPLRLRAVYQAKEKKFDDALDSLYSSLLSMRPNKLKEDSNKLERAADLEHQGDLNSDLSKRMQFYDLALEDVQNKLPHSSNEKYDLCLFAARICFKMKHFKSSESFCRWAVDLNSEDIEPKLLLFKLLEKTGSPCEIEKQFDFLWSELSQAWLTRRGFFN
jgi:tetratricopeptide (TPR) repeat protein